MRTRPVQQWKLSNTENLDIIRCRAPLPDEVRVVFRACVKRGGLLQDHRNFWTPTPTPPYPLVAQKRQGGWETFGADFLNTVLNANEALLATFTNQVFIYSSFQMVSDIQMIY